MNVPKMMVGAAIGGLATLIGASLVLHVILGDGEFYGIQRLLVAGVLQIVITQAVMLAIAFPRPKKPLTWAGAMVGAVAVAGASLLVFGAVPHEWISFADSQLGWGRRDLIAIHLPGLPFDISRMAVRDMLAAGVYTNSFVGACAMWLLWQRRHEDAEARAAAGQEPTEPVPAGTSAFGRPLSRQA